jgi:hypothetical protein
MALAEATAAITAGLAATMVGPAVTILPAHSAVVAGHIIRRLADRMADMAAELTAPRAATTPVRPMAAAVGLHSVAAVEDRIAVVVEDPSAGAVVDRAEAVAAAEAVVADHTAAVIPVAADARTNGRSCRLLNPNALRPA